MTTKWWNRGNLREIHRDKISKQPESPSRLLLLRAIRTAIESKYGEPLSEISENDLCVEISDIILSFGQEVGTDFVNMMGE